MMVRATSSGSTTRFNGESAASFFKVSRLRPATKSVFTAPGDTASTRIWGPSARPSDMVMVSIAALEAA